MSPLTSSYFTFALLNLIKDPFKEKKSPIFERAHFHHHFVLAIPHVSHFWILNFTPCAHPKYFIHTLSFEITSAYY